ncbi:MAG: MFS transporter, partial [Dehalococcoidia bacterium]
MPNQTPQQSLHAAVVEHAPYRASLAMQEEFVIPFGLALQATASQIGVLSTLPRLVAALGQLVTPLLLSQFGGRRVLVASALLGAVSFMGSASVVLVPEAARVWMLLLWSMLSMFFLELPHPAWGAWVSTLVPEARRGRYLAMRIGVGMPAAIGVFIVGGLFLDASSGGALFAFAALFMAGAALRVVSALMLRRLHEPTRGRTLVRPSKLRERVRELPGTTLGKFMLLSFLLHLGTWVASPYIGIHQLEELEFSYLSYMALVALYMLVIVAGMRFWGPFADRFGNLAGIRIAAAGIIFVPLLWIPVQAPWHAVPAQMLGGLVWGCMMLCGLNYVYQASTRENRAANVAIYNSLNGLGIFIGATLGGMLQPYLAALGGASVFTMLLLVSASVRLVAVAGIWALGS